MKKPKVNDALDIIITCFRTELQKADIGKGMSEPFYFKKAEIIFSNCKKVLPLLVLENSHIYRTAYNLFGHHIIFFQMKSHQKKN